MNNINEMMTEINARLDAVQAHLRQGMTPDLGGFDATVQRLCSLLMVMPPADAAQYEQGVHQMTARLHEVKALLAHHQQRIAEELQGLDAKKQAQHAYMQADASDDFGDHKNGDA